MYIPSIGVSGYHWLLQWSANSDTQHGLQKHYNKISEITQIKMIERIFFIKSIEIINCAIKSWCL